MSTVQEIEPAAKQLPPEDFARLSAGMARRQATLGQPPTAPAGPVFRDHSIFLNSYATGETRSFTTMPRAGELWPADLPFTSGVASKHRPGLVLWEAAAEVVVAAVTRAAPRSLADIPLPHGQTEGPVVPSTVRLSRPDCPEQVLLRRRLGTMSAADPARASEARRGLTI